MKHSYRKKLADLYRDLRSYREGMFLRFKCQSWAEVENRLIGEYDSSKFPREFSQEERAIPRQILALFIGLIRFKKLSPEVWEDQLVRFKELYTLRCLERLDLL